MLVGLGVRSLSMAPVAVPDVRALLSDVDLGACQTAAEAVFDAASAADARQAVWAVLGLYDVPGGPWRGGQYIRAVTHAPTLGQVVDALERLYPPETAEEWDAVGLVCGDRADTVRRVLFAVDPLPDVVDEALAWQADLLVTHHPLLLRPVHSVATDTCEGVPAASPDPGWLRAVHRPHERRRRR